MGIMPLAKRALLVAGMTALACAIDTDSEGAGKACTINGSCAAGYHCSQEGRCVASIANEGAAAGRAGSSSAGGHGGTGDAGSSGSGSMSDGQGGTGDADSEASLPDVAQDSGPSDAAAADSDVQPADTGCADPIRYFADGDSDGFGRDDSTLSACDPPVGSWATRGGDCNDADGRVFPGQVAFFDSAYARTGGDSFDYDCNGSEQPDPAQEGPAPNCAGFGVSDCAGSGFESSGRSGPSTDPICGSTRLVACVPTLVLCSARTSTTQPKRCR
jgi:hypothetical protein